MSNEATTQDAMQLAHDIIASLPEVSALQLNLAAMGVISITAEQIGNGDLAIRIGRSLIETGERVNAKSGN